MPPKDDKPARIIHVIFGGIEKDKGENPHKRRKVNISELRLDYKDHKREESWTEPIIFTYDELWEVDSTYDDCHTRHCG